MKTLTPTRWLLRRVATMASLCLAVGAAQAADPLTDALLTAYAPYRTALFQTNGKSQAESAQALSQARRAWDAVRQRAAATVPTPYAGDARLGDTLNEVDAVYREADALVQAGQLPKAHDSLERVRDLLADLRRRNDVVVFSDHMNAYHAEMEGLLREGPALLKETDGFLRLMARVGTLEYLATRLQSQATAELQRAPQFAERHQAVAASVQSLRDAVLRQDAPASLAALSALKSPYSRFFLKFG